MAKILLPVVITACLAIWVGLRKMWIEHLTEVTIRQIDRDLMRRHGANFYEADIKRYLGIWKFLRFTVMRKIEQRGWADRLPNIDAERGRCWLRRS